MKIFMTSEYVDLELTVTNLTLLILSNNTFLLHSSFISMNGPNLI